MDWLIDILIPFLTVNLVFLVWGTASIEHSPYLTTFCRRKGDRKKIVSLTFDDGVSSPMTEKVLAMLREQDVKATFFLVGQKVEKDPQTARRIVEEGHLVGSHSWSHDWRVNFRGSRAHSDEINRSREAIRKAAGVTPRYYRPPVGITTPHLAKAVNHSGVAVIGWSVRSFDTVGKVSRERIANRVLRKVRPGSVILLHDRCPDADRLTAMVIEGLKKKGYRFITPDILFGINAYE